MVTGMVVNVQASAIAAMMTKKKTNNLAFIARYSLAVAELRIAKGSPPMRDDQNMQFCPILSPFSKIILNRIRMSGYVLPSRCDVKHKSS